MENKFDALLQPSQPVGYLEALPDHPASVLAFIVPGERLDSLWSELKAKCVSEGRDLIDAITHRLDKDHVAETKRLRAVGFGRWLHVHGRFDLYLKVSPTAWHNHGITPLWCEYRGAEGVAHNLRAQFDGAQVDGSGSSITVRIPIRLTASVERDRVIDDAVKQMRRIAEELLKACPASA